MDSFPFRLFDMYFSKSWYLASSVAHSFPGDAKWSHNHY